MKARKSPPAIVSRAPVPVVSGLRPMRAAARIALFEKVIREHLSPAALDILLARAEIISEGQRTVRSGKPVFLGSTMLTIDLGTAEGELREPCDAATALRLARLMRAEEGVARRVRELAAREAERLVGVRPRAVVAELRVRASGRRVLVDVDVEATL